MHTRIVNIYAPEEGKMFIATMDVDATEHSEGAISHVMGSDIVNIRSNMRSYGAVPVVGKDNLVLLRDALIEICKMEGIE